MFVPDAFPPAQQETKSDKKNDGVIDPDAAPDLSSIKGLRKMHCDPIATLGKASVTSPLDAKTRFVDDTEVVLCDSGTSCPAGVDGTLSELAMNYVLLEKAGPRRQLFFEPSKTKVPHLLAGFAVAADLPVCRLALCRAAVSARASTMSFAAWYPSHRAKDELDGQTSSDFNVVSNAGSDELGLRGARHRWLQIRLQRSEQEGVGADPTRSHRGQR
jgi:hypothetical protein